MRVLTHTLKGTKAAAEKILEEVTKIFHDRPFNAATKNDWRLEYYIMQVMCSDMCASYEVDKDKIIALVNIAHTGYGASRGIKEINTAFQRLTRRGFLYGTTVTINPFSHDSRKVRHYGLKLTRYDTEKVEA